MTLRDSIRQETDIVSRRQSKSVHCRIIAGPEIISFMYSYGIIPTHFLFQHETGYDPVNGYVLAIPLSKWPQFKDMKDRLGVAAIGDVSEPRGTVTNKKFMGPVSEAQLERAAYAEEGFASFLKEVVVIVHLPTNKWVNGKTPSALDFDVFVESVDVGQATQGELVAISRVSKRIGEVLAK